MTETFPCPVTYQPVNTPPSARTEIWESTGSRAPTSHHASAGPDPATEIDRAINRAQSATDNGDSVLTAGAPAGPVVFERRSRGTAAKPGIAHRDGERGWVGGDLGAPDGAVEGEGDREVERVGGANDVAQSLERL